MGTVAASTGQRDGAGEGEPPRTLHPVGPLSWDTPARERWEGPLLQSKGCLSAPQAIYGMGPHL